MATAATSDATAAGLTYLAEKQLTHAPQNHDLDNNDSFSPNDEWLIFDTREDVPGIGANATIGKVRVQTGEQVVVYREPRQSPWGPGVGAASFNPHDSSVVVMRGLNSASEARPYNFWRRTSALVESQASVALLDARDVSAPFTPGALRGGTHRPDWSHDGRWIGFTYEDALLGELEQATGRKVNLRTIGVATRLASPVIVHPGPENHDGLFFSVIVARVWPDPRPGTDEIKKAFEDAWVGWNGYRHPDGHWQKHARAFLGTLVDAAGREWTEVFVADIPDRIDAPDAGGPLEGTARTMPSPPRGTSQRRLTFTESRKFPGVALLPRHWVRSSPSGEQIAYLAKDDAGIVQAFIVNPTTREVRQVTRHSSSIQTCVRWSPDGARIVYGCEGSVTVCDANPKSPAFGRARALTTPTEQVPESPLWSNRGDRIAFNRRMLTDGQLRKQVFLLEIPPGS